MPEKDSSSGAARRRSKRVLSPSQKYEIWLQLMRPWETGPGRESRESADAVEPGRGSPIAPHGRNSPLISDSLSGIAR